LDNLDSKDIVALLGDEFITSGEPTLPQEIPFDVLSDSIAFEAVILNHVQIFMCWLWSSLRSGWLAEELMHS